MDVSSSPPAVQVPTDPLAGEVARFWFTSQSNNRVAVGPYAVSRSALVVRGACRTAGAEMTWEIFDNSEATDDQDDIVVLDQGTMACDGRTRRARATVGNHTDLGVLAITAARGAGQDDDSAWVVVANE
jgi:hypothetical protein